MTVLEGVFSDVDFAAEFIEAEAARSPADQWTIASYRIDERLAR